MKPEEHRIDDLGVQHSQYFQGAGVSYTPWRDCAVGIGATAREAAEDAADSLAQNGWETEAFDADIAALPDVPEDELLDADDDSEIWHHIVIYVR